MTRIKTNKHYLLIFTGILILGTVLVALIQMFLNIRIPASSLIVPMAAALTTSTQFLKHETRYPRLVERKKLIKFSFLITLAMNVVFIALALISGVFKPLLAGLPPLSNLMWIIISIVGTLLFSALLYLVLRLGYKKDKSEDTSKPSKDDGPLFPQETEIARRAAPSTLSDTDTSETTPNEWQPVNDTVEAGYNIQKEKAPWGRWLVGIVFLGLIGAGAIWLASKVVVPRDLPVAENTQPKEAEPTKPKVGADDAAWVKALEKDTLAGYREYLEAFPEGKHAEEAKAEIAAYDDKAWARAQDRDTIAGYEEYIQEWPEGQHVEKARDRIKQIKDAAEAARKAAAEKAAAEARAWQLAAQTNTVQSYQDYLASHPGGPNAAEAQQRIDRLQADAADTNAWNAAKAAHTAGAYQQYLTSFPQGAYAAQAIAAIENLRPSPGRTFKDCQTCPEMVSLPAGTAELGAGETEKDARPNEKPQRPVTFADIFAISVREVTFAEYDACIDAGGCSGKPNDNGWGRGNRPVINVTWDQAQKYVSWLSSKSGKSYALPTEAQWEYAARAGDSNPLIGGSAAAICAFANGAGSESGFKWSNTACTDPAIDRTMPTGLLGANKFGVKDMIGNVAEWTQDCNTLNLRDAPTDGTADSRGSCNQRAVRGGSWFSGPADLRYAARLMQRRGDSNDFTGLRVVRKTGP